MAQTAAETEKPIYFRECEHERQVQRNLRALRQRFGYTMDYTAVLIGRKWSSVQAYECGRATPKLPVLLRIAQVFRVTLHDLVHTDLTTCYRLVEIKP